MLVKETWYYDIPFMHVLVASVCLLRQGMNVTVVTVARKNLLMA